MKMKNKSSIKSLLVAVGVAMATVATNSHAALDLSSVTGSVDGAVVVAAIGTVAGIRVLPRAASWAFRSILRFIPGVG